MNSLPLWLLIAGLALVYAGSDSDSDSDESKEKNHYTKRRHHFAHNHPVYPHYYGGLHGPQLTGYFPPQINSPPSHVHSQQRSSDFSQPQPYDFKQHPFYPQLPGYHQYPLYQQRPDGFQHPPAYSWLPTTATNIPQASSSSATSVINQQLPPVTSTQDQTSNPSSSSSSNKVNINQGTGSISTEAPYPTHNLNHGYEPLKEKSPGEYVYTLSNPDSKARSDQPECGENEVCNK